jgi:hypothetical protein
MSCFCCCCCCCCCCLLRWPATSRVSRVQRLRLGKTENILLYTVHCYCDYLLLCLHVSYYANLSLHIRDASQQGNGEWGQQVKVPYMGVPGRKGVEKCIDAYHTKGTKLMPFWRLAFAPKTILEFSHRRSNRRLGFTLRPPASGFWRLTISS